MGIWEPWRHDTFYGLLGMIQERLESSWLFPAHQQQIGLRARFSDFHTKIWNLEHRSMRFDQIQP